ncbi:unnamed protein product, partial [Iphiclides podalirius]
MFDKAKLAPNLVMRYERQGDRTDGPRAGNVLLGPMRSYANRPDRNNYAATAAIISNYTQLPSAAATEAPRRAPSHHETGPGAPSPRGSTTARIPGPQPVPAPVAWDARRDDSCVPSARSHKRAFCYIWRNYASAGNGLRPSSRLISHSRGAVSDLAFICMHAADARVIQHPGRGPRYPPPPPALPPPRPHRPAALFAAPAPWEPSRLDASSDAL